MSKIDAEEDQVINLMLNDDVSFYIQRLAKEKGVKKEEIITLFLREISSFSLEELQSILEKELSNSKKDLNDTGEF